MNHDVLDGSQPIEKAGRSCGQSWLALSANGPMFVSMSFNTITMWKLHEQILKIEVQKSGTRFTYA